MGHASGSSRSHATSTAAILLGGPPKSSRPTRFRPLGGPARASRKHLSRMTPGEDGAAQARPRQLARSGTCSSREDRSAGNPDGEAARSDRTGARSRNWWRPTRAATRCGRRPCLVGWFITSRRHRSATAAASRRIGPGFWPKLITDPVKWDQDSSPEWITSGRRRSPVQRWAS